MRFCSISDEAPETISKIVHVYWDGAEKLSKIDNGTLITEIPIDQDKSQAVEAKLREKLNNTNTDKSRKKRSIPFEGNGLSIVRKVCPSNYKVKKILLLNIIYVCAYIKYHLQNRLLVYGLPQ